MYISNPTEVTEPQNITVNKKLNKQLSLPFPNFGAVVYVAEHQNNPSFFHFLILIIFIYLGPINEKQGNTPT